MKRFKLILMVVIAFLLTFSGSVFGNEIKVGAGAAPVENILKPIKTHFEKATGIKLTIIASGPKIAMQDLERGAIDAATAGLTFDDWLNLMKKEGVEVKDAAALQQVTIGKDKIIVLLHKDNPVSKLSKDQLKGIPNPVIRAI